MFDSICNITPDQPWKQFLAQLSAEELIKVFRDAVAVNDKETAAYAANLLKKCSSTMQPSIV